MCSSRHVCTKYAYEDILPRGLLGSPLPMASSAAGPCRGGRERRGEGGATTGRAPPRSRPSPTAPPAPPGAGPALPCPAATRPLPAEPRAPARSLPSVPPRRPPRGPAPPARPRRRPRAARPACRPLARSSARLGPSRPRSSRTRRRPRGLAWLRGFSVGDAGPAPCAAPADWFAGGALTASCFPQPLPATAT